MRKISRRRAALFVLLAVLALLPALAQATETTTAPPDLDGVGSGTGGSTGSGDEGASIDPHG